MKTPNHPAGAAALPPEVLRFLRSARVAHLATADGSGAPSVIPICFAIDPPRLYTPIDAKPKTLDARRLQRVRNLLANPRAAVVVDRWDEDWSRIGWVLLRGRGEVIEPDTAAGSEYVRALDLLREKYPQYREMALEGRPMIRLTVETHRAWGRLAEEEKPRP